MNTAAERERALSALAQTEVRVMAMGMGDPCRILIYVSCGDQRTEQRAIRTAKRYLRERGASAIKVRPFALGRLVKALLPEQSHVALLGCAQLARTTVRSAAL